MAIVSGSFAGTGQSNSVFARRVHITMDFAGTATVDIERRMPSGTWVKIATSVTADYSNGFDFYTPTAIRLNCTAYTNAVEYVLQSGPED